MRRGSFLALAAVFALLLAAPAAGEQLVFALRGAMTAPGKAVHRLAARWGIDPRTLHPVVSPGRRPPAFVSGPRKSTSSTPDPRRWFTLRVNSPAAATAMLEVLQHDPGVAWAEPVRVWDLEDDRAPGGAVAGEVPWNVERVGAPAAWTLVDPDSTLLVAVIDTGADLGHPDLQARLWVNDDPPGNGDPADDATDQNGDGVVEAWERDDDDDNGYVDDVQGYDFTDAPDRGGVGDALERDADPDDDNGHGTHVAGIVAASGTLTGVAPFVRLMPVRAAYNTPFGGGQLETDDAAAAIVYAVDNGARVLNLSWGDVEESRIIRDAIAYAVEAGVLVVAAAGNGGVDAPHYPSGDPRVLGVGSHDRAGFRSRFSNFGPGVDLVAPGEEFPGGAGILSLEPRALEPSGRGFRRGTSMAAPHVAGAAAVLFSRADRPDAQTVRALLLAAARRRAAGDWTPELGHGELDVEAAVRSSDDLVVDVVQATADTSGFVVVRGTVWSGDLRRWRVDAAGPDGVSVVLRDWGSGRVVADTLVAGFFDLAAGDHDLAVVAETFDGRRREGHTALVVERTPPALEMPPRVEMQWRGSNPRWLVSVAAEAPVALEVRDGDDRLLAATGGLAARSQVAVPGMSGPAPGPWRLRLENGTGAVSAFAVEPPPAGSVWPRDARTIRVDSTAEFIADAVAGRHGGLQVVWGRRRDDDPSGRRMQAWGFEAGAWTLRHDAGVVARPVAAGDVDGNGTTDLLVDSGAGEFAWWVTRAGASFPDSVAARALAERAHGLFQLDADLAVEAVLSTADTLWLFDDVQAGGRLIQALVNPSRTGFNVWGPGAASGDFDADGRLELVVGDAEGVVTIWGLQASGVWQEEASFETGGSYAYDLTALPEGGFLVGYQTTASLTGDGFPEASWRFETYAWADTAYRPGMSWSFATPVNDLASASAAGVSPASGADWLALVRGDGVYFLEGRGSGRVPASWSSGARGRRVTLLDLDDDGRLEAVVPAPTGTALWRLLETDRAPHALSAASRGPGAIALRWQAGTGTSYRVLRYAQGAPAVLGTTVLTSWVDSTVAARTTYRYQIESVVSPGDTLRSARVPGCAQPLPRLLEATRRGDTGLQLVFSNPMDARTLHPDRFEVRDATSQRLAVREARTLRDGRAVQLVLGAEAGCGSLRVRVQDVSDTCGGGVAPGAATTIVPADCGAPAFFVAAVSRAGRTLEVRYSRPYGPSALDPAAYRLTWDGLPQRIATVEAVDAQRVAVHPGSEVQFVARGEPYVLFVDGSVRDATGAPLQRAATGLAIHVGTEASGAIYAVPNPVRSTDVEAVFVEAPPGTRIDIFNLEGERVRRLEGGLDGGIRWDLRTGAGSRVRSGVYLWVARTGTVVVRGRLAVQR